MTEQEAKRKWCPFVRHTRETDNNFPSTNRGQIKTTTELYFNCIGSACMAWRWMPAPIDASDPKATQPWGFCGLASKP